MSSISLINSVVNPASCSGVASSSNGQILYASFQQETGYDFYYSTNSGVSWGALPGTSPGLGGRYTDIACNGAGTTIYTPWQGAGFFRTTNSGSTWTDISTSLGNGEGGDNIVGGRDGLDGYKVNCLFYKLHLHFIRFWCHMDIV